VQGLIPDNIGKTFPELCTTYKVEDFTQLAPKRRKPDHKKEMGTKCFLKYKKTCDTVKLQSSYWVGTIFYGWLSEMFAQHPTRKRAVLQELQKHLEDCKNARALWQSNKDFFEAKLNLFLNYVEKKNKEWRCRFTRKKARKFFMQTMENPQIIEQSRFARHMDDTQAGIFDIKTVVTRKQVQTIFQSLFEVLDVSSFDDLQDKYLAEPKRVSNKIEEILKIVLPQDKASEAEVAKYRQLESEGDTSEQFYHLVNHKWQLFQDALNVCIEPDYVLPLEDELQKIKKRNERALSERWLHMLQDIYLKLEILWQFKFMCFCEDEWWGNDFKQLIAKLLNDKSLLEALDKYLFENLGVVKTVFDQARFNCDEDTKVITLIYKSLEDFDDSLTKMEKMCLARGIKQYFIWLKCYPKELHYAASLLQAYVTKKTSTTDWDYVWKMLEPLHIKLTAIISMNNLEIKNLESKYPSKEQRPDEYWDILFRNNGLNDAKTIMRKAGNGEFRRQDVQDISMSDILGIRRDHEGFEGVEIMDEEEHDEEDDEEDDE
jgi:hypothetical protein